MAPRLKHRQRTQPSKLLPLRRHQPVGNDATNQANGAQPAPGATSAEQTAGNTTAPQDVSLPPVSSTPAQGQAPATPEGQQRVEVQGDLNNALTLPQNQQQVDYVVVNSTLPTEPATVAPIRGGNAQPQTAATETKRARRKLRRVHERKQAVMEPKRETKPQAVVKAPEVKAPAQPKHTETAAVSEPAKAPVTQDRAEKQRHHSCTCSNSSGSHGSSLQRRSRQNGR